MTILHSLFFASGTHTFPFFLKLSSAAQQNFPYPTEKPGRPGAWNADKVTEANVDALLDISDYYQAGGV